MRSLTLLITLGAAALAAQPDPNRGLYAIWTTQDPKLAELPFIKGGQVLAQWKEVEAHFALDPEFARSLRGRPATVNVVYLDRGRGAIELHYSGKLSYWPIKNTGRWRTATFPVDSASKKAVSFVHRASAISRLGSS